MSEINRSFGREYVGTAKKDLVKVEFKPEVEQYGISKPRRKIIRAKIIE